MRHGCFICDPDGISKQHYHRQGTHFKESFEYAEKAVELDDMNSSAHKWYGISLNSYSGLQGTKKTIQSAFVIKEHWERAKELAPNVSISFFICMLKLDLNHCLSF